MMTRLQFLRSLGQLGLAAACVPVLAACKADDDEPTPDANNNNNPDGSMGNPADAGVDGSTEPKTCATVATAIGTNHGHTMTVSAADVSAGVEKTYQIQGTSLHPHTVVVTAADFETLKMTGTVSVASSMDPVGNPHSHSVTVTCTS